MVSRNKLTNNSDETLVGSLLSGGDNIFSIPYFQRAYKWKKDKVEQLQADLLALVDEQNDFHFLGAIIVHGRPSKPSEPTIYEVIDGQQRITTIFLFIAAAVKTLLKHGETEEATAIFQKYLSLGSNTGGISNFKLHSCKEDRAQLNIVLQDLVENDDFRGRLSSYVPRLLSNTGKKTGPLINNYKMAKKFFASQFEQDSIGRVRNVYTALLQKISLVEIDVWDPTNGPKIFDSLNSRQEPMTTGDLVRNEIFSRVASLTASEIESVDDHSWQPFYQRFKQEKGNLFEDYFFPYGLTQDPNLKKSEVFSYLRKRWEKIENPTDIIKSLSTYQAAFIDLKCGLNSQVLSTRMSSRVNRLHRLKAPSSSYPYFIQLTTANQNSEIDDDTAIEILEYLEGFFVRRALCGIEPTGLHAVFKKLWVDCDGDHTKNKVEEIILGKKTVITPTDQMVDNAIKQRKLYGSSVTNYFLAEYNVSLGGDIPSDSFWIEHILPQKPVDDWLSAFKKEEIPKYLHLLGNLVPLSEKMNQELGNKAYSHKREKFAADSMFKAAREIAELHSDWTPEIIENRGELLSSWALERWPGPEKS